MEISRRAISAPGSRGAHVGVSELFQTWRSVGAVRVALRQGTVFRRRFQRGDLSLPPADARFSGSRPEFLRAEHDARSRWTSPGVGLGQRLSGWAWMEWLPVLAAPIEFVA